MRKLIIIGLTLSMLLTVSCSNGLEDEVDAQGLETEAEDNIDIDLTEFSSTMVYSEVYNMVENPDAYVGKVVKAEGTLDVLTDIETGKKYFTVIVADATSCCSQGIEFVWKGEHTYPDDYPEIGTEITVTGTFNTYVEYGNTFFSLYDADLVIN